MDGAIGATGAQGPTGNDGTDGIDGTDGTNGVDGAGFSNGTVPGEMMFWDGSIWKVISPPTVSTTYPSILTFNHTNNAPEWSTSLSSANSTSPQPPISPPPPILGCIDATAFNYNALANTDDGSCVAVVNGCTDATAFNYNALANKMMVLVLQL